MKESAVRVGFACAVSLMSACSSQAQAPPADLINPQIQIKYIPPSAADAGLTAVYNRLQNAKPLETLQQFLAPLKLDRPLLVQTESCGATYPRYVPGGPATLCYEFVQKVESSAPTAPVQLIQTRGRPPVRPSSGTAGPIVQELLHEVAVALFEAAYVCARSSRHCPLDTV